MEGVWVYIGAIWRIRLNHPCAAAMRPYVKLLHGRNLLYLANISFFINIKIRKLRTRNRNAGVTFSPEAQKTAVWRMRSENMAKAL